ncbi:MAG: glucose-1-phosphate cytidylyltransferase [Chloroflexi bacterium]|nr:glucose-1-phosphate cytidylyltransferase [Chloroflexota bacterium]
MKVVLFCGGQGLRIRDLAPDIPKPMIRVGELPILLHIMKYYAHFGHTDFILCLGYKGEVIKDFFLRCSDASVQGWNITFVGTGLESSIGERLRAVESYVAPDRVFLANYADVLTDAPLPHMIDRLIDSDKVASCLCVQPRYSFHIVSIGDDASVTELRSVQQSDLWINGGYFVFRRDIFAYLRPGEDLVEEPFRRLIRAHALLGYRHTGFWAPMDTLKEWQSIQIRSAQGDTPWTVWERSPATIADNVPREQLVG